MRWAPFFYSLTFLAWFWIAESSPERVHAWVALTVFQSVAWCYLFEGRARWSLNAIALALIVTLGVARAFAPIYEDDYRRYLWDAQAIRLGVSPYSVAPGAGASIQCDNESLPVAYGEYKTVYPPFAEALFTLLSVASNNNCSSFLFLLSIGGLSFFIAGFVRLLLRNGVAGPIQTAFLFLLHPLLLKEWVQSAHYDVWVAGAIVWALCAKNDLIRAVWVGVATQFKLVGILLLGELSKKGLLVFSATLSFIWVLPIFHFQDYFFSLSAFGRDWEMNAGIFRWVREALAWFVPGSASTVARILGVLLCFAATALVELNRKKWSAIQRVYWILFFAVIFSPIVNPWYFTWGLPLALFLPEKSRRWALLSYCALPLSYLFYAPGSPERWWDLEHLLLLSCAALSWRAAPVQSFEPIGR